MKKLSYVLIVSTIFSTCFAIETQEVESGSPSSVEALDTKYLPPPPTEFRGTINLNAVDSTPLLACNNCFIKSGS